jgi:acyl-coenzyme A synthetase/AMP-(fatty) acid ligase
MREEMGGGQAGWWGAPLLERHPDEAVWAQAGQVVTYQRLRAEVASLRRLLQAHGIRRGDTVALQGSQSFSQVWSLLALWSLGAQVMLMGPRIRGPELGRLLDQCRPRFYVSFTGSASGGRAFYDECEICVYRMKDGHRAAGGHCLVHFTSGTTGSVKAVARTGQSLLAELETFRRIGGMPGAGSRVLVLGPVMHSLNLVGGLLHHMDTGAVSLFPSGLSPSALLRAALLSGADTVLGAPRHFAALTAAERPVRLPRLRRAVCGGDRLPVRTHARFAELFGVRIGQAYGTTETGIIAADPEGRFPADVVGVPAAGVTVRVVEGEVWVRMAATPYPGGQEGDAPRFVADTAGGGAGWLRTRDRARCDPASGALRILGRLDPPPQREAPPVGGADRVLLSARTASRSLTRGGAPAP